MSGPLTATLEHRAPLAPGIVDLVFRMVKPPRLTFQAGQFVSVGVSREADGSIHRRSYSIASHSAQGDRLRLILRLIDGGAASAFFMDLPVGAEVDMTGPHGFFVLDRDHLGDVLFAATGTGMAPVIPMLAEMAGRAETGRRLVYWGVREEADLFARTDVAAACRDAGATLRIFISRPAAGWPGDTGRITGAILEQAPSLRAPTFYLVGNGAMITELKKGLMALGVDRKKQIRTEAFFD